MPAIWKWLGLYVCHVPPKSEEALVKRSMPEKVLLFARSVEEAAGMVYVPPAATVVLLMVARLPVR